MNDRNPSLGRRKLLGGAAATVGTLAAAAALVPSKPQAARQPDVAEAAQAKPEAGGGYQLTEHVKQYYATARI
jgi:hypothetical protein